jgi:glycosyltransferase involved in cell wall biosynthesis
LKTITLSSNYSYVSGYGIILESLLKDLPYNIIPRSYGPISSRFDEYFNKNFKYSSDILDLTLLSISNDVDVLNPLLHISFDRRRVLYTMWESTRVNDLIIEILNKFKCIIVPNDYNKINFINQGLNVPVEVVNLFCDTETFVYKAPENRSKFVFGISNEDPRKNIDKVTRCFLKAFKNIKNVELQVKTCGEIKYKNIDSRIVYTTNKLSKLDLRNWYYNLDVYVSGATCEGWGMMQQESMCCGRPLIYTDYAGLSEFVNYNNGFEVGYTEVFSTKQWGGFCGKWSEFNEEELVEKMVYCYNNKKDVQERGYISSVEAKRFTVNKFINNLTDVINLYI